MRLYIFLFILISTNSFSQTNNESFKKYLPQSTYYANTLSVHPFGIFTSRVNNNFQIKPDKKPSITINFSSGNIWLPYVKAYNPLNDLDRATIRNIVWHEREAAYDINRPSEITDFHADGVIREYKIRLNFPISDKHEIKINSRMFSLDPGNIPYSLVTSDQFIEWFHSNLAGGEDPFARKDYGFNHAKIHYRDANGKTLQLNKGDFMFSGIDLSYYYYPNYSFLERRNIYTTAGFQTGFNLNKINPSLDLGVNFTVLKGIKLKSHKKELRLGVSLGALRQKLFRFGDGIKLSNNILLFQSEFYLNM